MTNERIAKYRNNIVRLAYHASSDKDVELKLFICGRSLRKNFSRFRSACYLSDLEKFMNIRFHWISDLNFEFLSFFLIFSYKRCLGRLKIKEDHIAKLVPHRIFSMAFHPAKYKTLVVAGDKWGNLGIWNAVRDHF